MEHKQASNTDHPAAPAPSSGPSSAPSTAQSSANPPAPAGALPAGPAKPQKPVEIGGPSGPEPTRYGDWERNGRVSDF